jgi:hypothetical protein
VKNHQTTAIGHKQVIISPFPLLSKGKKTKSTRQKKDGLRTLEKNTEGTKKDEDYLLTKIKSFISEHFVPYVLFCPLCVLMVEKK